MQVRFVEFGRGYRAIKDEIDNAMQKVLSDGQLILRQSVEDFEESLAQYVGTKYAIGVASGTDALFLSLKVAGIQPGDKVLIPSYTFRATAEAAKHAGGVPVLYDLDGPTFTDDIKFWIPAHIAGKVDMTDEQVMEAKSKGIIIIEDACQAIGAAPIRGETACYSFYPAKILGCYGDGGAIATNNERFAYELKIMRNHYKNDWKPYGWNSRLDNLQAEVLNVKIKKLPEYIARRKEIAEKYDAGLANTGITLPEKREVYQDYIITLPMRDELHDFLKEAGIETMKDGYPFPEELKKCGLTEWYEEHSLRLPCTPEHLNEEIDYVIEKINAFTK